MSAGNSPFGLADLGKMAAPAVNSRPAHEQRVIDEERDLVDRLEKLLAFIERNPAFRSLPGDAQQRLKRQSGFMASYWGVLTERIAAFPK